MEHFPKLKITGLGWNAEELHDFAEAKYLAFTEDLIVTVEGQIVASFEEFKQVALSESNRHKKLLEVVYLPVVVGG